MTEEGEVLAPRTFFTSCQASRFSSSMNSSDSCKATGTTRVGVGVTSSFPCSSSFPSSPSSFSSSSSLSETSSFFSETGAGVSLPALLLFFFFFFDDEEDDFAAFFFFFSSSYVSSSNKRSSMNFSVFCLENWSNFPLNICSKHADITV